MNLTVYIDLGGTAPPREASLAPGSRDYERRARREARVYINELRRLVGKEPVEAKLAIGETTCEFGCMVSVICRFHPWNPIAEAYAQHCAGNGPHYWDVTARRQLRSSRRRSSRERGCAEKETC